MKHQLKHNHDFSSHNTTGKRRTYYVLLLTLVTMVVEITAGTVYGSMALLADGWHMGTHAAAFCITIFAYHYAQKHQNSEQFSFGTGKVSVLGGYTSAIVLGIVALLMFVESLGRLFNPHSIQFNEAILVAFIGLAVNVASMFLLDDHHHDHNHAHSHNHDHNLRAAYLHVLADALTSVLAIAALFLGKFLGWHWLDAIMGMVGALVIAKWTFNLLRQTSPILLDENIEDSYREQITSALSDEAEVTDLHVWKVSGHHYSAAITLMSNSELTVEQFKEKLSKFHKISHLTLEVHYV
ncbi:CDF family Co(II)/Ni(II) efflux transporter DmeF [Photobacterium nomapromontoriensis]|uniref:CDF family Co(II)/Ni(II) efflux transporter DmeF n=1 Tax=Photobacterium nomapromontoriensis TaxID=2910237 RepID=UPI003D0D3CEB